ncbi:Transforming acidic coiled-coil-containing protein 2 [Bienertia sinuspersici]
MGGYNMSTKKIFNLASTSNELCEHAVKNARNVFEELEQLRLRTGSENGQDDFVVSTQGSNDATQTDYHEQQNAWDGVENPPPGKRIGRPPSKTPYGFPQQKKSKGSTRSKGSTEGSVTKPAPQRTQLMEQCMNSFYNTLSQTSSLGYQVPLQFDVHRPPRPDFRWAINEQQHSQSMWLVVIVTPLHLVMTTEVFRGLRRQFRLLRVVRFVHYIQGPSLTGGPWRWRHFSNWLVISFCSSPASVWIRIYYYAWCVHASNGQPTLLPQPLPRAVTSFLPPRPC